MSSVTNKSTLAKEPDEIDLGHLLGEILDHRKLIFSITAFFTICSIFYALLATPIYQADALVQVEQKQGNAILNNLSQMLPDSQPASAPEIALLQSRMILGKTVDELNLQANITQNFIPIIGHGLQRIEGKEPGNIELGRFYVSNQLIKEGVPQFKVTIINADDYNISGGKYNLNGTVGNLLESNGLAVKIDKIDAEPGTTFTIDYYSRLQTISNLKKIFAVADQGKDTGMLTLSINDENPQRAAKILNSITNNYLLQNIARQAAQDEKSLEFLDEQLPKVRGSLDDSEDKLNHYRQQKDSVDLTMEAKSVLDQIVNVDNQLNELTFRESEVSQLYTKEHPTYKALLEKRQTLQDEKSRLNKKVSGMPETQQEVLRLSRDVDSGRAVYMQLLNRQQELSIAKSSAIGNIRIIDDAVTQMRPVQPKKTLIIVVGFVLGFMFSLMIVLIRMFLRKGIETPQQLEDLGINVYASVPISEKAANNKNIVVGKVKTSNNINLLAIENPADLAIEAIRGLRTTLYFAMMEAKNNVLMISGASPNAGKTFISTNLATIISQTGKKVLFIDTDMRKGYVHKIFNDDNKNGLSDYLSGKVTLDKIIKSVNNVGIDFISRGFTPPNPTELLMHTRFSDLVNWCNDNYDLVVIDTPPILAVTDPALVGRYVGTTLLVARFEQNTAKEIETCVKRFEQNGVTIKGCILNGVVKKASNYYGYGYSYHDYSYEDKK